MQHLSTLNKFSETWGDYLEKEYLADLPYPDTRLSWILHCGGSQGLEASIILYELEKLLKVRTIMRNYLECEHTDTISNLPPSLRDSVDRAALKRWVDAYEVPAY